MSNDSQMGRSPSVDEKVRLRVLARLRALMAHSVANGATADEELAAARMVGKMVAQLDGTAPPAAQPSAQNQPPSPSPTPQSWAEAERKSPEYQRLLQQNVIESLFKTAVQELAINYINTVSPPRRRINGEPVERVGTRALIEPQLTVMLAPDGMRLARDILGGIIDELIQDGALPQWLDIPLGD